MDRTTTFEQHLIGLLVERGWEPLFIVSKHSRPMFRRPADKGAPLTLVEAIEEEVDGANRMG